MSGFIAANPAPTSSDPAPAAGAPPCPMDANGTEASLLDQRQNSSRLEVSGSRSRSDIPLSELEPIRVFTKEYLGHKGAYTRHFVATSYAVSGGGCVDDDACEKWRPPLKSHILLGPHLILMAPGGVEAVPRASPIVTALV